MHELSIASGVCESVNEVAKDNHALSVKSIDLVVGTSTAIIEEALIEAFKALVLLEENALLSDAKINVETCESRSICVDCGVEFSHGIGAAQCPKCESCNTQIISGTDIYIKQIEIEEEE